MISVESILDEIIRREGGFVDHPADRGGPTKYGVTQRTLSAYRARLGLPPATRQDVADLTEREARSVLGLLYAQEPNFHRIAHEPLRALIVDCGVHHGQPRAARWLQRAAGARVDGRVGPKTLAAVHSADGGALYRRVLARRCRFMGRIVTKDPTQAVFAAGWNARLAEFIEETPS